MCGIAGITHGRGLDHIAGLKPRLTAAMAAHGRIICYIQDDAARRFDPPQHLHNVPFGY